MIVYMSKPYVAFLSLNKKVTKEVSPGEALGANVPSPGNPTRHIYDTFYRIDTAKSVLHSENRNIF